MAHEEADAKRKTKRKQQHGDVERERVLQARAQRQHETVTTDGTWATTAHQVAATQGFPSLPSAPPAFASLRNERCIGFVRDMYEA